MGSINNEQTGLLTDSESTRHGNANFRETTITIAKTCMGTGTLALAYAASQGGLLLSTFGLCLIGGWNAYAMHRLCLCLKYLPESTKPDPPSGTSMFGKVAWHTFGPVGLHLSDILMISLLIGILVAYQDAIVSFLQGTPLTTGSSALDAFVTSIVIAGIATVPDMGHLSTVSAVGLGVLASTFVIIALKGGQPSLSGYHLWPPNGLVGMSHWFGCVVFSYGVVPLTYNFYEGMARPQQLMPAASLALSLVAMAYVIIGCGLLLLYPAVSGDIMGELPTTGIIPTLVRLAFVLVIVLTSPLLLLPCGEMVEGKIIAATGISHTPWLQGGVRFSICVVCTATSIAVPGFVVVLSFVGCCSMSLVCFVLPPVFHVASARNEQKWNFGLAFDTLMILWGITSTLIATGYALHQIYEPKH